MRRVHVMAIDSIQDTVSMFEPIFQDGTDTVCVMDQIRDEQNTDSAGTNDYN